MPKLCDELQCTGCGICAQVCPGRCIIMQENNEGFLHPQVDATLCVRCGLCEKMCPVLHTPPYKDKPQPKAFAAHAGCTDVLEQSSSGGVFTLLAMEVLNAGGIVFGASFDENWNVRHVGVETAEELARLRGSKYVQSALGDTCFQAKQALDAGRQVLFSGTPCQIAGLRRYLKKEYNKLLCVDIICHSVPSPKVWRAFIKDLEDRVGGRLTNVNFRDKRNGWDQYCFRATFENGAEERYRVASNPYMRGFLKDLSTRPSCYHCKFKGISRESDITLGDFWGVQTVIPEAYFEKGTSLVLVNSEKGRDAMAEVAKYSVMQCVDLEMAVRPNPAYSSTFQPNPNRNEFFERLSTCEDLCALIYELTPDSEVKPLPLFWRIRGKFGRLLRQITGKS